MQLPESAVRDTAAAIFADPAYNRTSLLDRLGAWLLEGLEAILMRFGPARPSPTLFWFVVVLISAFVLLVLGRTLYGIHIARAARSNGARGRGVDDGATDAWNRALALAAAADYTAAAHALYAALLARIARREDIALHDSKTIGDYTRDLRHRASGRLPGFREFAALYETIIYGLGVCDRERYERLQGLALRVMESGA